MERKVRKIFIRALSAVIAAIMFATVAVPCLAIATGAEGYGMSSLEPTYNQATTTTRKYTFNDSAKYEYAEAMLKDPAKYNGSKSFQTIYGIFKEEIKNNTNGYSFGKPKESIGSITSASWHDSSWDPNKNLPKITEEHPRLLVTKDTIPTIRKSLEEVNPTNERFFALLDMDVYQPRAFNSDGSPADTVVNGKANGGINMGKLGAAKTDYFGRPGTHNYDGYYLEVIQVKALGYLIDGHELYGMQAIHCMKQFLRTLDIDKINSNQEREFGNVLFTVALVYDWCYDLLDAEDKKQLMAGAENKVCRITNDYGTSFSVGFPPSKLGAVSGHGSERQVLRDMLAASIAFYDENQSWYNYIGALVYEHYVPVRNYYFRSGISQQGVGTYVSGRHIADMFSAWIMMTSTGSQPYENINKTVRNFLGYEVAPGKIYTDGDGSGNYQNDHEFRALAYMTAYMFEDEAMLALAKDMLPNQAFGDDKRIDITIELQSALYVALTGMSDMTPAENKYEGMPLIQYNGSPVGQYITHEAFGVNDSASVFMKIKERTTANHEHADAGNFMIYYKGMLTADGGVYNGYAGAHTRYYHQATVSHNSVLVYDSSKANVNSTDLATKWYSGGQIWPNEAKNLAELKTETYHTGNVLGNRHGYYDAAQTQPKYAYINGNIVYAYPSETVSSLGRRMLTVYTGDEDVPMLFFVYDTIGAAKATYEKKSLLQITSSNAPTIDSTNKTVTTVKDGGKLVLTVMSPDTKITGVGGRTYGTDGKYIAASSKNYLINGKQNSTTNDYDTGAWGRVEISATNNSKSSKILNAMYVTDATNSKSYSMKPITEVTTLLSSQGDFEGAVFEGKIAAVFAKKDVTGARTGKASYMNKGAHSFTTEGTGTMQYYVDGLEAGNWQVTVNGKSYGTVNASYGLLVFEAEAGKVVLTKESAEVAAKKTELISALGAKLDSSAYTTASYTEYTNAYNAIVNTINTANDLTALNAIDVATLKAAAEAKLVTLVDAKKAELKSALGSKKSNSNGTYTTDSYSAYSTAYDSILSSINSASTMTDLNAINVATLKAAAESKLVSSLEDKRAALKSELGTKKSNSSGTYTSASYSKYSTAFDQILADINGATTLAALNAIDVAARKTAAEANLVTAVSAKKEELKSALGTKKSNTSGTYTADSYSAYSTAFDSILSKINSASTMAALNAIDVASLKSEAEAKLVNAVDAKKAELKAELGSKKSNSNGTYSADSYSAYSTAYDAIVTKIDSASTMSALNAIDVATLKAAAEANLVSSIEEKRAALKSALGSKKSNSSGTYTSASYSKYSTAFDQILADINGATTLAALNAIDVATLKTAAEANLVTAVSAKKEELKAALGSKKSNSNGTYTADSYSAYSTAFDSILSKINSASTMTALNAIDVASLKSAAEANLVTAVSAKKEELKSALGSKKSNSSGTYTADSYSAYSTAYDSILSSINNATTISALNAIDVASLKSAAEAKLVTSVSAKKEELKAALGSKKSNSNGIYSADSYSAYSTAYDSILSKINSATTMTALNAIDVASLKAAAEANLVSSVDDKKEELKNALGTKISNSNGIYTSDSYSKYSAAYDQILADINGATTLTALNAIDVEGLKSSAEAMLVNAVDAKKAELKATLGSKRSSAGYTIDSYAAYSSAYDSILSRINAATTLTALNAIDVVSLRASAEAKLVSSTGGTIITTIGSSASADLTLDYTSDNPTDTIVYSIDVIWDDLSFAYNAGTTLWNPDTHAYDGAGTTAAWLDASGKVTITNHSNAAVAINVKCNLPAIPNGTATFKTSITQFTLNSAVGTTVSNAPKKSITITAEGEPTSASSIGTIVITVSRVN